MEGIEFIHLEGARVAKVYPTGMEDWAKREFDLTAIVREEGIEAPFMHELVDVEGRPAIVFDEPTGPDYLDWMLQTPGAWRKLGTFFAYEHHEIHLHQSTDLPNIATNLEKDISLAGGVSAEVKAKALTRLKEMPKGTSVLHWNYCPRNVIVTLDGPVKTDWSRAAHGHFLADVARTLLLIDLQMKNGELDNDHENMLTKLRATYEVEYLKIAGRSSEELRAWMLPITVARLGESRAGEKGLLIDMIAAMVKERR